MHIAMKTIEYFGKFNTSEQELQKNIFLFKKFKVKF